MLAALECTNVMEFIKIQGMKVLPLNKKKYLAIFSKQPTVFLSFFGCERKLAEDFVRKRFICKV